MWAKAAVARGIRSGMRLTVKPRAGSGSTERRWPRCWRIRFRPASPGDRRNQVVSVHHILSSSRSAAKPGAWALKSDHRTAIKLDLCPNLSILALHGEPESLVRLHSGSIAFAEQPFEYGLYRDRVRGCFSFACRTLPMRPGLPRGAAFVPLFGP